jgi:hypothetical protein
MCWEVGLQMWSGATQHPPRKGRRHRQFNLCSPISNNHRHRAKTKAHPRAPNRFAGANEMQNRAHGGWNAHSARSSPNWFRYHFWNLTTLPSCSE